MNSRIQHAEWMIAEEAIPARTPWLWFFFLLAVFYVVMPFELRHSVRYQDQLAFTDVDVSITRIEEGSLGRRLGLMALAGVSFVSLTFAGRGRPRIQGALGWAATAFVAWAAASLLWSHDPALTTRRLVVLAALTFGALAVAGRFAWKDLMRFTLFVGLVCWLGGLACEVGLGTFRPWESEHRFGGFINPVYQGIVLSMAALAAVALAKDAPRGRTLLLVFAAATLPFIVMTRSRVPLAGGLAGLAVYGALVGSRMRKGLALTGLGLAVGLFWITMGNELFAVAGKAALLGRETSTLQTFTGRVPLWTECLNYAAARPLIGYGYDSFWTPNHVEAITDATGFPSVDTHNAYLDWLLGLGLPGVALGVAVLVLAARRAHRLHDTAADPAYAFAAGLVVLLAVNLFSLAIHIHHIETFIVLAVVAKLGFWDRAETEDVPASAPGEEAS